MGFTSGGLWGRWGSCCCWVGRLWRGSLGEIARDDILVERSLSFVLEHPRVRKLDEWRRHAFEVVPPRSVSVGRNLCNHLEISPRSL